MSNITLKQLYFSNMFSYGKANVMRLDDSRITQLTAPNGSGKSSIAMIIQEILFNKNVKGIKKTDILNRWVKEKQWNGSIEFDVEGDDYGVSVQRSGATTKVQFIKNGIDISDHKVLDTYKKIQEVVGLDFEVFSQLTYQSSTDLLEFLKATDANRKKFLINLFNLEKYITIGERIKVKSSETDKEYNRLMGELKTIDEFLALVNIPNKVEKIKVPEVDKNIQQQIGVLQQELDNYEATCKKIDKNNMYLEEREALQFYAGMIAPDDFLYEADYQNLKQEINILHREISTLKNDIANIKLNDVCKSCGQSIDTSHLEKIKADLQNQLDEKSTLHADALSKATKWSNEIKVINTKKQEYIDNKKKIDRFEHLTQLIDDTIPKVYPNVGNIESEINELNWKWRSQNDEANDAIQFNENASISNAKRDALIDQKNDFTVRQKSIKNDILVKSNQINSLNILKKAFSTSGIVAFKLENLTKELEIAINSYLSVLSDGQFQVEFKLDKEKLNISVINNGISPPIETVSGGEFSRIQTSILLAIRSLLSKLGGSSVNLLFLDEITGVLDEEGKEKLVEVLQQEENLNVFLISHDFTHPLIDKISITKEKNISSIQ